MPKSKKTPARKSGGKTQAKKTRIASKSRNTPKLLSKKSGLRGGAIASSKRKSLRSLAI